MRDLYSTDLEGAAHAARADAVPDDDRPTLAECYEGPDDYEGPTDADVPVTLADFAPTGAVVGDDEDRPF